MKKGQQNKNSRLSEAFVTGMSFTGEVKENQDGKPVAVFKGNFYGLNHGPITGLAAMFMKTEMTEAELLEKKFNSDASTVCGREQSAAALEAINNYNKNTFKPTSSP